MNTEEAQSLKNLLGRQARELGYGTIALIAKVHDSGIFDVNTQQFTTHSIKDGNPETVKLIIKLIKGMQESLAQAKAPGSLTLTIDFNKTGQSTKVVVQNTDKHRLQ